MLEENEVQERAAHQKEEDGYLRLQDDIERELKEPTELEEYEIRCIREEKEAVAAYEDHLYCTQQDGNIDNYLKLQADIDREQYEEKLRAYEPGYHLQEENELKHFESIIWNKII
jgi:hypothetical protein